MMRSMNATSKRRHLIHDTKENDDMEEDGDIDQFNDETDAFFDDSTSPLEQRLTAAHSTSSSTPSATTAAASKEGKSAAPSPSYRITDAQLDKMIAANWGNGNTLDDYTAEDGLSDGGDIDYGSDDD